MASPRVQGAEEKGRGEWEPSKLTLRTLADGYSVKMLRSHKTET